MEFKQLADSLLRDSEGFLFRLFPSGSLKGSEFMIGSLRGEPGDSLSVNINTGKWADFAEDIKGGDLISLYAAAKGIKQSEAYAELGGKKTKVKPKPKQTITYKYSEDLSVQRVEYEDGSKAFFPNFNGEKKWPTPRPLFMPDFDATKGNYLIVEGEKAALAAHDAIHRFNIISWPGGSNAVSKADWDMITNTQGNFYLWPDCDDAGRKAMAEIKTLLVKKGFTNVNILDPEKNNPYPNVKGWDAYDYFVDGKRTYEDFVEWAKTVKVEHKDFKEPEKKPKPLALKEPSNIKNKEDDLDLSEDEIQDLGFAQSKTGIILPTEHNVFIVLMYSTYFKDFVYYDTFYDNLLVRYKGEYVELKKPQIVNLLIRFQKKLIPKLTFNVLKNAIYGLADHNKKSEPAEFFKSLEWDGIERLKDFHKIYCVAEDKFLKEPLIQYTEALGKNLFTSIVNRVFRPGCKFDNMFIWEGDEGILKSTALGIIGGKYYMSSRDRLDNKDFYQNMRGSFLIEMQELGGFLRLPVEDQKSLLSQATDKYRGAYEADINEHPRQSVIVATTNDKDYIHSDTGARRMWPIRLKSIDLDRLKEDRDQLFAEAVALYKQDYKYWDVPQEVFKEFITEKVITTEDPYAGTIFSYLNKVREDNRGYFTTKDIFDKILGGDNDQTYRFDERQNKAVQKSLRVLGYIQKQPLRYSEGDPTRYWHHQEWTLVEKKIDFSLPLKTEKSQF